MKKPTTRRRTPRSARLQHIAASLLFLLQTFQLSSGTTNPLETPTAVTGASKTPITALPGEDQSAEAKEPTKKKTKKKKKKDEAALPTDGKPTSTSSKSTASLSTAQSVFVRRVQSEWRDAVKMGIAYNWVEGKPIRRAKKKKPKLTQAIAIGPMGPNLFFWHFSFSGMENSTYDGGIYHGRLILPPQYPSAPPRVQVWTPSGRFVPRADICLSASAFHPETWNPAAFSLRTIIESLRLHVLTPPTEIGGTTATPKKRRKLAKASRTWTQVVTSGSSSKKSGPAVAKIDHSKMIEQGVFPRASDEKEAVDATQTEEESVNEGVAFGLKDVVAESQTDSTDTDSQQSLQKVKTKKSRQKSKSNKTVVKSEPIGFLALTVKAVSDNRPLRIALVAAVIYMVLFGK